MNFKEPNVFMYCVDLILILILELIIFVHSKVNVTILKSWNVINVVCAVRKLILYECGREVASFSHI
jgi:hypothetical protein